MASPAELRVSISVELAGIEPQLRRIQDNLEAIMATESSFADRLTSIQATLVSEDGAIATLTSGVAGLRQQIADLTAQLADGAPVSQAQLEALDLQASEIQSSAANQLQELTALATPTP